LYKINKVNKLAMSKCDANRNLRRLLLLLLQLEGQGVIERYRVNRHSAVGEAAAGSGGEGTALEDGAM